MQDDRIRRAEVAMMRMLATSLSEIHATFDSDRRLNSQDAFVSTATDAEKLAHIYDVAATTLDSLEYARTSIIGARVVDMLVKSIAHYTDDTHTDDEELVN